MKKYIYTFVFALLLACGSKVDIHKRTTLSMGTIVEIQIKTDDIALADKAIDSAFTELQRINDKYSVYKPNTYLNKINSSDTFQLDEETYFLLIKCEYYNKISNGAFDPAIGNIIKALGFENTEPENIPEDSIKEYIKRNNWKLINLMNERKIIKPKHVRINLGAIAKGYAVDQMFNIIKSFGFNNFLVNAGGEVRCIGDNWDVGIQHPRQKDKLLGVLKLKAMSVATSGDYERFRFQNGKRISHIFNPITCRVADECQSVTIICEHCIDADAIATTVFVLGPEDGLKLIGQINNCQGLIIDKNGKPYRSPGFEKYFFEN